MSYYTQFQAHHCQGTVAHTVVLQDIHMSHIIAAFIKNCQLFRYQPLKAKLQVGFIIETLLRLQL